MSHRRYVILDRDGTINEEVEYLRDPAALRLLPGAVEGLRRLRRLCLGLVVVSNQSGIGRGYFSRAELDEVNARLIELLAIEGVKLDGIYCCPHSPDEACTCRKPLPGLVLEAAQNLGFDPAEGFMIGDKASDIALGKAVSSTTLLVRTGYGSQFDPIRDPAPDFVVDDLVEAAETIASVLKTR